MRVSYTMLFKEYSLDDFSPWLQFNASFPMYLFSKIHNIANLDIFPMNSANTKQFKTTTISDISIQRTQKSNFLQQTKENCLSHYF